MLYLLVDIPHLIFLFLPVVLPFFLQIFNRKLIWPCFLRNRSHYMGIVWRSLSINNSFKNMGGLENTQSNSAFFENISALFYNPFIKLFGGNGIQKT